MLEPTQQQLLPIKLSPDGGVQVLNQEGQGIDALFATGWRIISMVGSGPEGLVLLLIEKPAAQAFARVMA